MNPEAPLALRLSGQLMLGVVRIYNRKVSYLFQDCSEALVKIKGAFARERADLPEGGAVAVHNVITLPENYDDLEETYMDMKLKVGLWTGLRDWEDMTAKLDTTTLDDIDTDSIGRDVATYTKLAGSAKRGLPGNNVVPVLAERVEDFKKLLPAVMDLRNPHLLDRHWKEIETVIGHEFDQEKGGVKAYTLGDLVALGQPLGFGMSYIVIEQAVKDHPDDELPLAALQCMLIGAATLGIASASAGAAPWDLPFEMLLPAADAASTAVSLSNGVRSLDPRLGLYDGCGVGLTVGSGIGDLVGQ